MTIGEIERHIQSKQRVEKVKAQEKAAFDYILAGLIGANVMHFYSPSSIEVPRIEEAYSSLFESDATEKIQDKKKEQLNELSALRFKQFANSYNTNYKEVQKVNE